MQTTRASIKLLLAVLTAAVLATTAGCAVDGQGDSGTSAVDPASESPETVDCLVNTPDQQESATTSSQGPTDPCAEFSQSAVPSDSPCSEVWKLDERFPAPYYGCNEDEQTDDGTVVQVFDLGAACSDPSFEGFWLYGDLMAREGGPIAAAKVDLLANGLPDC